jgi:hypothetical protein
MGMRLVKLPLPVHDQLALTTADPLFSWMHVNIDTRKEFYVSDSCLCSEQANDLPSD